MQQQLLTPFRKNPWAAALVAIYLVLGVIFSVVNPLHEATDELRHYRYVRYIADFGQLPVQSDEQGNAQAHHPPLYYASAALLSFWIHPDDPLYEPEHNPHWSFRNWEVGTDNKNQYLHGPDEAWPYRDNALAVHLARWVTLLWGAGVVLLTYLSAQLLIPERTSIHLLAGAIVGLNPMFVYLGAAVNNDVPAALIGAAILYASLLILREGVTIHRLMWIGVLYALGLLVKFNLLAMLAVIEIALLFALLWDKEQRDWRTFWKAHGIIIAASVIIAGWWYIRNTVLYGEPTGFLKLTEIWGVRDPRDSFTLAFRELSYAWTSLWARFGYGQIPMPTFYYTVVAILCSVGVLGAVAQAMQWRKDGDIGYYGMLMVLAASVIVNLAVLYVYITVSPAGAMGRFFFPGLPAMAILVAYGLIAPVPEKIGWGIAGTSSVWLLSFTLIAIFGYVAPAYAMPERVTIPDDTLNVTIGNVARIVNYEVSEGPYYPGTQIDVSVTWEVIAPTVEPYQVFVHILNTDGAMVAQRDTYAGTGNYPSHFWQPGHVFTETYRVFLSETTYTPDDVLVLIGLWQPGGKRLPIQYPDAINDAYPLVKRQIVQLEPESDYPNPVYINWDKKFALVGWTIKRRVRGPEQGIKITLYWQALNPPPDEDFITFVHVRDGWANIAGIDMAPVLEIPTSLWQAGEVYESVYHFYLPPDITPGVYLIEVGWFSDDSGERLNIIAEDGHIVDDWLNLNVITVYKSENGDE